MANSKELSCGIIISNGSLILAALPFGKRNEKGSYDILKGRWQEGETHIDTAVRETQEESGLVISPKYLVDLGIFNYRPKKGLHLFFFLTDSLPNLVTLKCSSYFSLNGKNVPEMASYRYIEVGDLDWFLPSLVPVLEAALLKYLFLT